MAFTPKEGQGAMFKNDKGDNPNRPDYKGDIMLNGEIFQVSGWLKQGNDPTKPKFLSLKAEPKRPAGAASGVPTGYASEKPNDYEQL